MESGEKRGRFIEHTGLASAGLSTTDQAGFQAMSLSPPSSPTRGEKPESAPQSSDIKPSFWSRCHDRWFFVFFVLNFTAYTILSCYAIFELTTNFSTLKDDVKIEGDANVSVDSKDIDDAMTKETAFLFMGATGLALILCFLLLFFIRHFPAFVIYSGPALAIICCFAGAGCMIFLKSWSLAVILGLVGIILIAAMWFLRGKFRLARCLLDTANKGAKAHSSVFWIVIIGLFVEGLNSLWNLFTFFAVLVTFAPTDKKCQDGGNCSMGLLIASLIFVLLSHLWTSSVIGNVVIMTLAGGPYATWWNDTATKEKSESWSAFKKSISTSLGSIAFGSLLVGLAETIGFVIKTVLGEVAGGNCLTFCCFCIIDAIEKMLAYFNKYVYINIGVDKFGIGFIPSAKEIMHIVLRRRDDKGKKIDPTGINAVICDSIVGFSLHTTCIACAIICTALTYLGSAAVNKSMKLDNWWNWLILVYAFILALNIGLVLTSALEAGVSTVIICLHKKPSELEHRNPDFYFKLTKDDKFHKYSYLLDEK